METDDLYLVWSHEHGAWWGPGGSGYTHRVSQAGRYPRGTALKICADAVPGSMRLREITEMPVRLADVAAFVATFQQNYPGHEPPWH